jgi:hypothetical protein
MKKLIENSILVDGVRGHFGRGSEQKSKNIRNGEVTVTFNYENKSLMAKAFSLESEENVSRKDEYLAKQAQIVKAETEEEDKANATNSTIERTKKVPNREKVTRDIQTNSLKISVPRELKGSEAKAYVLEQINNHLAS